MSTALTYETRRLPQRLEVEYASRRMQLRRREPYQAAIPASLASADFTFSGELLADCDDATRELVRFDGERSEFIAPFSAILLRTESASSSQIEQLTAGPRAIAEAVIGERAEGNARLVVSNVHAMEAALALADEISNASIIAMHTALLDESSPELTGGYRQEQVWIGGALPQTAAFAPPHHERVAAAMNDLILFMRRVDLPVLPQVAIAHAQFETIHPFPDGNGRTGRALAHSMLRHGDILRHLAVPVSAGLLTDIGRYFDALDAYRSGDAEPIVRVFADASLAAVANADQLADDLIGLRQAWQESLAPIRAGAVGRKLASLSLEYPVLNAVTAERLTGASRPAVVNGLETLVEYGILQRGNSAKRNRTWINPEVLDALTAFSDRTGRRVCD
ncbi:Fic family protein [Leifsonia virtsii]|uniref:Fic family protein n=1 Tax=Leifsonia virtsii TaxID=3035915 RepID=A0ABT8IZW0_9MICO|nr:Fic family protein [Leifsonia virtsii]MDN4598361.1 Fic family protein [Leifsonia virtsii]